MDNDIGPTCIYLDLQTLHNIVYCETSCVGAYVAIFATFKGVSIRACGLTIITLSEIAVCSNTPCHAPVNS